VERYLKTLPSGLDAIYNRMLQQIAPHSKVSRLIRWAVMAIQPMTLGELREALSVALEKLDFNISACVHFLSVADGQVNLIHQSAKDYLLHRQSIKEFPFDKDKDEDTSDAEITLRCLDHLRSTFDRANQSQSRYLGHIWSR
jgi:hypothetical protein